MSFFNRLKKIFHQYYDDTKVYGFVGSSGSGKSYSVDALAEKYEINLIIDDGLLIKNNKVLTGISAKQESNELMAVKRAIFIDNNHRMSIVRQLDKQFYPRILLLGTSVKMVERIRQNLFLPPFYKIIHIESIRSKEEIEYSHKIRNTQGKHIIPLPYIELKRYISEKNVSVLIDESFLNKKTLVSPKFSRTSNVAYTDAEITKILEGLIQDRAEGLSVVRVDRSRTIEKTYLDVYVHNKLDASKEYDLRDIRNYVNRKINTKLEDTVLKNLILK